MTEPIPHLHADTVNVPRTETAAYFSDGRPAWGTDHARPAASEARALQFEVADLKRRLLDMTDVATKANRDAARALEAEEEATARAEDAEDQMALARAITIRILRRPQPSTIEAAMDRAARTITGRTHPELSAYLDQQVAAYPDETVVVDEPTLAEWVSICIGERRTDHSGTLRTHDPLVALAVLVEHWLDLERQMDVAERTPGRGASYELVEALDAAQVALARAVRR